MVEGEQEGMDVDDMGGDDMGDGDMGEVDDMGGFSDSEGNDSTTGAVTTHTSLAQGMSQAGKPDFGRFALGCSG